MAKGYSQKSGVDFNETFAPVAMLDTVKPFPKFIMNFTFPLKVYNFLHFGPPILNQSGSLLDFLSSF